jgi:hypothetical protein
VTLDHADILARSREGAPFSNNDQGDAWMGRNCDRCLRDAPFRNGINATGCPILLVAMCDRTPAEWRQQRAGDRSTYVCVEFRAQGGARPHRRREPRSMDGLFERPKVAER